MWLLNNIFFNFESKLRIYIWGVVTIPTLLIDDDDDEVEEENCCWKATRECIYATFFISQWATESTIQECPSFTLKETIIDYPNLQYSGSGCSLACTYATALLYGMVNAIILPFHFMLALIVRIIFCRNNWRFPYQSTHSLNLTYHFSNNATLKNPILIVKYCFVHS